MKSHMFNDSLTVELAMQTQTLHEEFNANVQRIQEEAQEKLDAMSVEAEAKHKELWNQIYEATGLDSSKEWSVDLAYVEHNLVFLLEKEQDTSSAFDRLRETLADMDRPMEESGPSLADIISEALSDGRV